MQRPSCSSAPCSSAASSWVAPAERRSDPWRADAEIDAFVAQYAMEPVRFFAARDGVMVDLP